MHPPPPSPIMTYSFLIMLCSTCFVSKVRGRGRPALEAHKTLMSLEQALPRVYKKVQAAVEGALTNTAPAAAPPVSQVAPKKNQRASSPPPSTVASSGSSRFDDDGPSMPLPRATKRPALSSSSSAPPTSSASSAPPSRKPSASAVPARKGSASSAPTSSNNDKEDDTVEELSLTPEDAQEALGAIGIEGWEGPVQEAMASANWQVKAEAVTAIGQKIADLNVGGQYSAPLVVYLSSKTSGFKITNVNILKAVIQTACLAATHTGEGPSAKFSKAAAWELIKHLGDKLSDKKTKDVVGSLLTALSGALRPVFVVKRMKVVMDKTKAPLAHQYYLEWLKDAVTEFGASSFPVPALGAFCQLELDNKVAAVRTAAVEVMGALYHQIGPRLASVAMSDDMKPAVRTLLEAEFSRVGHDPAAGKVAKDGGGEGLSIPRQDLFTLLDKNILSELNLIEGKTSWQNRKVALESVIAACERSGHFLDASKNMGGPLSELLKSLKARVGDTQANLKPIAAVAIGHVIASLEPEHGTKQLRVIAAGLIAGLGDNKKPMRDATVSALQMAVTLNQPGGDSAAADMGLLSVLIAPLGEALAATVVGRQELLSFLILYADSFHPPVDCSDLPVPLVQAMQDKTAAVRSLAEQLLGLLNARALISKHALDKATRDLAPAAKRTLMPSVERMITFYGTKKTSSGEAEDVAETVTAPPSPPKKIPVNIPVPLPERKTVPLSVSTALSPPTVRSSVQSLRASTAGPIGGDSEEGNVWMLKKISQQSQQKRFEDFHRCNWPQPPEEIGESELSALRGIWEPLVAPDLATLLFPTNKFGPPNQDGCLSAVSELCNQLQGPTAPQHTDLLLRYACYALCLRETAGGLLKVLQLITEVLLSIKEQGHVLHEAEISCILPHLIDKSGHKSERHKAAFKTALAAAAQVMLPSKLCHQLLQGLTCKNKRTRVVCIEEIQGAVEAAGAASLGRAGVREVAVYLDSKDNDVSGRNACLELCYALYLSLGAELGKLTKLMGPDISERSTSMIDDRIRQKNKAAGGLAAAIAAFASNGAAAAAAAAAVAAPTTQPTQRNPSPKKRPPVPHSPVATAPMVTAPAPIGSPDREDNDFYEASPSPFKLEVTPPLAPYSAAEGIQMAAYSSASPQGLMSQMDEEGIPTSSLRQVIT
jgi:hypothetical protein